MELITKVNIDTPKSKIGYKDKILMLGSCFSNEIGLLLNNALFNIKINPFGTLYNPYSIANSVERLANCTLFCKKDVILSGEKFTTLYHHSSIFGTDSNEFLIDANSRLKEDSNYFKECSTVIITLGTAWAFRDISSKVVVSNCHKIKASNFSRELLSVSECKAQISKIITLLEDKRVVFTISPIRHLKDGAHGNQISKSTLILALNEIMAEGANISYFPSYEIMMDELRDYRFYAADMVHPSPIAVEYIFEKFKEHFILPSEYNKMIDGEKISKALNHRPLFPNTEEYKRFRLKSEQAYSNFIATRDNL